MPDIAAQLLTGFPAGTAHFVGDRVGCVILIAAHDLQHAVRVIGHCIEANQLMCHRDRQQCGGDPFPVVDRLVVEISPMEVIIRIELAVRAGIGKIQRFIRIHGDKNLNQRKQAGKDTLSRILLDLIGSLTYRDPAFLQLDMNDGHSVDQQHQIPSPVIHQL